MSRKSDAEMIGKRVGALTVVSFAELRNCRSYWNVVCDCGETKVVRLDALKSNSTCDKCKAEKQRLRMLGHGETKSSLYQRWRGIKSRCNNPNSNGYDGYGGRGITMYPEWYNSYEKFKDYVSKLDDYGVEGYTIDRIDVNGNYEPGNIRWVDWNTQANNKRVNHPMTLNGKTLNAKQWSNELGIKYSTLMNRIKMGWSDVDVLTRPIEKHNRAV